VRWSQAGRRQESVAGLTASIRRPLSQLAAGRSAAVRGGSRREASRLLPWSAPSLAYMRNCGGVGGGGGGVIDRESPAGAAAAPYYETDRQTDRVARPAGSAPCGPGIIWLMLPPPPARPPATISRSAGRILSDCPSDQPPLLQLPASATAYICPRIGHYIHSLSTIIIVIIIIIQLQGAHVSTGHDLS